MIIYHGSKNIIEKPEYGKGKPYNDYGRGFYCTEYLDLAKEWAVCRPNEKNGCVHTYTLDINNLNIFDFQKVDILKRSRLLYSSLDICFAEQSYFYFRHRSRYSGKGIHS